MLNLLSQKKQIGETVCVCVQAALAYSHFFCLRTVTVSSRGNKSVVNLCVCVHVCYTKTPSFSLSLSSNFVSGRSAGLFFSQFILTTKYTHVKNEKKNRRAEPPSTGGMMTSNSSGGLNGRRRVGKTIVLNGVRENRDNSKNKPSSLEEEEEENTRDGKSNDRKRKKAEDEEEEEDGSSGELYPLSKIQMEWQNVSKIGSGLQNLGNTCFLNAVLQCLTYTPALANFFLNNEHQKHKNLTSGFNSLFEMGNLVKNTLVHSKNKHHAVPPTAFVKNIRALSKTFKKGRQEDSHEFARCLLDSMHKRCCMLGRVNGGKSSSARNGKQVTPIDPESKEAETTFIWRVFGGQLRSCVTCQSCGRESAKLDPCMDMSLECAKVKSLEQALKLFTRVEVLDGDNKYRCEGCKKLSRAKKQFSVDKAPNVLQIQLKRFEFVPFGRGKLSQFIEYPLVLNLTSYLTSSLKANEGRREKKRNKSGGNNNMLDDIMGSSSKGKASSSSSSVYDLIGVLVHAGSSMNSGHYYSYVKAQNGFWFEMDDESVTSVSEKTVLRQKAYLLFYSLRNAPGTMTTKKTNTGNVDKNRMEELTRDFQAKKRKLDEEREKGKKTMTMKQERDSNINKSGSGNGSSSSSEGEEEEEKEEKEEEEVVTVISARKNGKRGAGRSVGKNSRDVVKSKLFKQNRSGSKSPDFGIVKQKKRSKRASYSEDDTVAYDEEEDKENKREKGNMMVKTFMKSRAQRDKSTQRWNDGDDDDDNDKSEALRMRQQSSKPQKKNAKKSREYDELDEEYDRGKIAKHLRRREQKMPARPVPSRAAGGNAFARKQGRKYQR